MNGIFLGGYPRSWFLAIGRDFANRARFAIHIGFGRNDDVTEGEVPYRWYWKWSSTQLPYLIWCGWWPIGFCAFGRCRVFA